MDIKDRISKLLALADSPNLYEAQTAMLKAQQLMVEHKLTITDFEAKPDARVIKRHTGINCSKRRDYWIVDLASVIAKNYCCKHYWTSYKKKQTVDVGFVGFEDDWELCNKIFHYALESINSWIADIRNRLEGRYDGYTLRSICDSYADGFIAGISAAYEEQQENHQEWGLVLVIPQQVKDACTNFKIKDWQGSSERYNDFFSCGYNDGIEFNPATKLPDSQYA